MKKQEIKKWILKISAIVLPAVLLVLCFRKFDLHLFWNEVENAHFWFLSAAFLSTSLILFAMVVQWRLFLPQDKPVGFGRMFQVVSLFTMLVNTVPFWGGHAFAVYLLGVREKVGKTAALSVMTLEQIAEGFGKILVFALVAFFCPFPSWMKTGMQSVMVLVLTAYFFLVVVAYRFKDLEKARLFQPLGWRKFLSVFAHWAHHLHALRSFPKMSFGILLAIGMKAFEAFTIYLVQLSFGVELPYYAPLLMLAALGLSTMLPLSPGRLGVFEATAFVIYQYLGVGPTQALTLGLFLHMAHTLPFVLVGYGASWKRGIQRKEIPSSQEIDHFTPGDLPSLRTLPPSF